MLCLVGNNEMHELLRFGMHWDKDFQLVLYTLLGWNAWVAWDFNRSGCDRCQVYATNFFFFFLGWEHLTSRGGYTSYSSSWDVQRSCRHCPAPSSSAASCSSFHKHIWHNCRHLSTASSSAASYSSFHKHIWHNYRHLSTAFGSAASFPKHIRHNFRHLSTASSSAALWWDYWWQP